MGCKLDTAFTETGNTICITNDVHVERSVLEYRVSWVRIPPEAAIFLRKSDCLGCAVLLCLVCLFDLACFSFFLLIFRLKTCMYEVCH